MKFLALAFLGITTASLSAQQPKQPNLLLIYADDQSFKTGLLPRVVPRREDAEH